MVLSLFSSTLTGGNKNDVKVQLSKATDSGVIDVPKDLFEGILEASYNVESRRAIMMHIFECFNRSTKAKGWCRIHAALILTEELVLNGSPDLVAEIALGHHFDLLQQLSFLEKYADMNDHRKQNMVRSKAQSVRKIVAPRLQDESILDKVDHLSEDNASTCSPGEASPISEIQESELNSDGALSDDDEELGELLEKVQGEWQTKQRSNVKVSGSVATWSSGFKAKLSEDREVLHLHFPHSEQEYHAYLRAEDGAICWSDGDIWRRQKTETEDKDVTEEESEVTTAALQKEEWHGVLLKEGKPLQSSSSSGKVLIHGIVSVGHSSDTETESSANESPASGHNRGHRRMKTRRERNMMSSGTNSESSDLEDTSAPDLLSFESSDSQNAGALDLLTSDFVPVQQGRPQEKSKAIDQKQKKKSKVASEEAAEQNQKKSNEATQQTPSESGRSEVAKPAPAVATQPRQPAAAPTEHVEETVFDFLSYGFRVLERKFA